MIADSLLAFVPYLKVYTEYINGFDVANARMEDLVKNSDMYRELTVSV